MNVASKGAASHSHSPSSEGVRLPVPRVVARSHRFIAPIVHRYFRSEVRGQDLIPSSQTILVAHHDGGVLPINGLCIGTAWIDHFGTARPLFVLTHEVLHHLNKRFTRLLTESGLVRADRKIMDQAIATGESVLVLPGAARETFRTYWQRREIDLGGRSGFVAQAIRWRLPITPVVSAGSHETVIVLAKGQKLAKALGIPKLVRSADVLPVVMGLPWGIWALPVLPQLPLPAKITTEFLAPIWLPDALGRELRPEDADDQKIVAAGFEHVLGKMRGALNRLYDERRWPVIG